VKKKVLVVMVTFSMDHHLNNLISFSFG